MDSSNFDITRFKSFLEDLGSYATFDASKTEISSSNGVSRVTSIFSNIKKSIDSWSGQWKKNFSTLPKITRDIKEFAKSSSKQVDSIKEEEVIEAMQGLGVFLHSKGKVKERDLKFFDQALADLGVVKEEVQKRKFKNFLQELGSYAMLDTFKPKETTSSDVSQESLTSSNFKERIDDWSEDLPTLLFIIRDLKEFVEKPRTEQMDFIKEEDILEAMQGLGVFLNSKESSISKDDHALIDQAFKDLEVVKQELHKKKQSTVLEKKQEDLVDEIQSRKPEEETSKRNSINSQRSYWQNFSSSMSSLLNKPSKQQTQEFTSLQFVPVEMMSADEIREIMKKGLAFFKKHFPAKIEHNTQEIKKPIRELLTDKRLFNNIQPIPLVFKNTDQLLNDKEDHLSNEKVSSSTTTMEVPISKDAIVDFNRETITLGKPWHPTTDKEVDPAKTWLPSEDVKEVAKEICQEIVNLLQEGSKETKEQLANMTFRLTNLLYQDVAFDSWKKKMNKLETLEKNQNLVIMIGKEGSLKFNIRIDSENISCTVHQRYAFVSPTLASNNPIGGIELKKGLRLGYFTSELEIVLPRHELAQLTPNSKDDDFTVPNLQVREIFSGVHETAEEALKDLETIKKEKSF